MSLTAAQIKKTVENAAKTETPVTVERNGDSKDKSYTGKLVRVEDNDEGQAQYAVRSGRPGRPLVITLDKIRDIKTVAGLSVGGTVTAPKAATGS